MLSSGGQYRVKTSSSSIKNPTDNPLRYVTELHPNDILMGRGAPIINYEGNVRFRELVRTRKVDYVNTTRHQVKDEIARCILQEIKRRDGHFLRRIDSEGELRRLGISEEATKAWIIVDNDVALEKVKQALRDKDPEKMIDNDALVGSNFQHRTPDFSNEARSFSAPFLSNDIGWIGGQGSRLHELLKSHSAPSNLAFRSTFQDEPSHEHLLANGIPAAGPQIHRNQSFTAGLPPATSFGAGFRTSDYLREYLRRTYSLSHPSFSASEMVGAANMNILGQQYAALGSAHPQMDQANRLSSTSIHQNHQQPLSHGSFESSGRLPSRLLPPLAQPMESIHLSASSNTHISVLKSLLDEQEIMLQRQLRFGTTTHPSDFSADAAAMHFGGSRGHTTGATSFFPLSKSLVDESTASNTVARMPPVSSREKVETNCMEGKNCIQCPSLQRTSDDRKRKSSETEALTSLISADNAERAKKFVGKERNKKG
jgi:hypothetical protein